MTYGDFDPDDRDAPQAIDLEPNDDDDDDTVSCPNCGRELYEGIPKCPQCGFWIIDDSPAAQRARGWAWPIIVATLIAIMLVMWHGLGR